MAARCRECKYWIVDGKCACNDPTVLRPRQFVHRATCTHTTPTSQRVTYAGRTITLEVPTPGTATHVRLDLGSRPACAGCTGWVRQYCPRARECA